MTCTNAPTIACTLLADGFAKDTARAWASCPMPVPDDEIVAEAREWRTHGFAGPEAAAWYADGWLPDVAARWHIHGYTPDQARFVEVRLVIAEHAWREGRNETRPDRPAEWRDSGLHADVVTMGVAWGLTTLTEGYRLAADLKNDPMLHGTLTLLLDVRGIDLRAMKTAR